MLTVLFLLLKLFIFFRTKAWITLAAILKKNIESRQIIHNITPNKKVYEFFPTY